MPWLCKSREKNKVEEVKRKGDVTQPMGEADRPSGENHRARLGTPDKLPVGTSHLNSDLQEKMYIISENSILLVTALIRIT